MDKFVRCSIWKQIIIVILFITFCLPIIGYAIELDSVFVGVSADKHVTKRKFIHKIGIEFRPEYIVQTNPFLKGVNHKNQPFRLSKSAHIRYSFQPTLDNYLNKIYGYSHQGIGFAGYKFGNKEELGDPFAVYIFQGARISQISNSLSLNYEWNFGLSCGWEPYDSENNKLNVMMGSKINAYLNVNFLFEWMLSRHIDLYAGITMTHFSNGNTYLPNAGMNTMGLKTGITYNFGRDRVTSTILSDRNRLNTKFRRHVSYDMILFGSWCSSMQTLNGIPIPSPHKYTVLGFNFAPMYNFNQKFRLGLSIDGVYNGSANIYTKDNIAGTSSGYTFYKPSINEQLSLGISARGEFSMPYFTIGVGLGVNTLYKGDDLKAFYQIIALKIAVTRSSFIHIGYCLRDFKAPNYLMLGIGYKFNNKSLQVK